MNTVHQVSSLRDSMVRHAPCRGLKPTVNRVPCLRHSTSSHSDDTQSLRDSSLRRNSVSQSRRDNTLLTGGFNPRIGITYPTQSRRDDTSPSCDVPSLRDSIVWGCSRDRGLKPTVNKVPCLWHLTSSHSDDTPSLRDSSLRRDSFSQSRRDNTLLTVGFSLRSRVTYPAQSRRDDTSPSCDVPSLRDSIVWDAPDRGSRRLKPTVNKVPSLRDSMVWGCSRDRGLKPTVNKVPCLWHLTSSHSDDTPSLRDSSLRRDCLSQHRRCDTLLTVGFSLRTGLSQAIQSRRDDISPSSDVPSLRDSIVYHTPDRGLKPTVNKVPCLWHLMMYRDCLSQHRRCDTLLTVGFSLRTGISSPIKSRRDDTSLTFV